MTEQGVLNAIVRNKGVCNLPIACSECLLEQLCHDKVTELNHLKWEPSVYNFLYAYRYQKAIEILITDYSLTEEEVFELCL